MHATELFADQGSDQRKHQKQILEKKNRKK